jgi:hypothetical protein
VPHVHVSRISGDPLRLSDAVSYLASEVRPAVERQHGSLGTALLISPEAGAARFESFWAPGSPLARDETRDETSVREAARRAGGTVTAERYEVLVFERTEPLDAGRWVRMTPMDAGPSQRAKIEDTVTWYGDTAVPQLADTNGFAPRCCTPTGLRAGYSARPYGRIRACWQPAAARRRRLRLPPPRPSQP